MTNSCIYAHLYASAEKLLTIVTIGCTVLLGTREKGSFSMFFNTLRDELSKMSDVHLAFMQGGLGMAGSCFFYGAVVAWALSVYWPLLLILGSLSAFGSGMVVFTMMLLPTRGIFADTKDA
jgi:hypothetical protein